MNGIEKYLDYSKEQLEKEIENQKEKIKRAKKLIKFLNRLMVINGAEEPEKEPEKYQDDSEESNDYGGSNEDKSEWSDRVSETQFTGY